MDVRKPTSLVSSRNNNFLLNISDFCSIQPDKTVATYFHRSDKCFSIVRFHWLQFNLQRACRLVATSPFKLHIPLVVTLMQTRALLPQTRALLPQACLLVQTDCDYRYD